MWLHDLTVILEEDMLECDKAKKLAGRLQWASCHIFQRCAKSALRPIIQRQTDSRQGFTLSPRLRQSICWFIDLLQRSISRTILHSELRSVFPRSLPIVYSDATGKGACGAVIVYPSGNTFFCRHQFPQERLERLKQRKTQITAFELWAAALAILTFVIPEQLAVFHYVDNKAALACLIKAHSSLRDLNNIAGGVMHKCSLATAHAYFIFVKSKENLADGPSRDWLVLMDELGAHEVEPVVPDWSVERLDWLNELM
jgi:hypothetical protein